MAKTKVQLPTTSVKGLVKNTHRFLLGRPIFYKLNTTALFFVLRSLGVHNYENIKVSGEAAFLKSKWVQKIVSQSEYPVFLDIGAHMGEYANRLKKLYPHATVYAFEPHPKTFQHLQTAAAEYAYTAKNVACSDVEGNLNLYDYSEEGSELASLCEGAIDKIHHKPNVQSWEIQSTTIDRFIQECNITQINLMEIDTEGYEFKVLLGCQEAIRNRAIDMIQFEFNSMNVFTRVFFQDFQNLLKGYCLFRILPNGGLVSLEPYEPLLCEIFRFQNIVAIRKECM